MAHWFFPSSQTDKPLSTNSAAKLPLVIINGSPADTLSVYDRAFQYGDGLFETIAIMDGKPALLAKHLKRLERGLHTLGFPPVDLVLLEKNIRDYSKPYDSAVLKLTVTRGESARGYRPPVSASLNIVLSFSEYRFRDNRSDSQRITIRRCSTPASINPVLAGIKHLNRLEQVLASNEWNDSTIADGLMCDPDGNVIEATSSNVFLYKDNVLLTPDLARCGVAGVVRELVLEMAETLSIPVRIKTISIGECLEAEALFLTNSLKGILPVSAFDSATYSPAQWPKNLFNEVMQHVFS